MDGRDVGAEVLRMADSLAGVDVDDLHSSSLAELALALERLTNVVHGLSAVVSDAFEQRGSWAADGALSGARWVADRTGTAVVALRSKVRAGAALRHLPTAAAPARNGRLSPEHLRGLGACVRKHPDLARRDEAVLVTQAVELDAEAFRAVARRWQDLADDQHDREPPGGDPVQEVHLSRTLDGWWRLDGLLAPDDGELLHAALDQGVDAQLRAARDGDPSVGVVASQMRADALVDLAAQAMRHAPSDAWVPDRYRVAVTIRHDEVDHVAACDSTAYRAVLGAGGEVLDIGRETRRWPTGIRRAITLRDGGCVFPGCDRPPSWTDIHHCRPWECGGATSVDNGALLCRRHHTFLHRHRWRIEIPEPGGKPQTRRPDGSRYEIVRWGELAPSGTEAGG